MENNQFEICIDYDKNLENPERVFYALAKLVSEFSNFNNLVCESLAINVNSKIVLEKYNKVESGSVHAIFKDILENIDDESLSKLDWKGIFGNILVKCKYKALETLNKDCENKTIDVKQLQNDIFELSKPITQNTLKVNTYIAPINLAKSLDGMNRAFGCLTDKDKVKYITKEKTLETKYNPTFSMAYEKTQLIEQGMITSSRVVLVVKKPDLLGESQWNFIYNNKSIQAKIEDEEWLMRFQNREFNIQPKDSIECDLRIQTVDIKSLKTETTYTVTKVHEIIEFKQDEQQKFIF